MDLRAIFSTYFFKNKFQNPLSILGRTKKPTVKRLVGATISIGAGWTKLERQYGQIA